ncbi:hypothetical protein [Sphaerisporangium dianthi]|uniref:Uncharacterized protein n=1 Tax=Sphaerisporangium dianthi TaxID=1436120 RepID=A0ABV9CST9_9ACTN
MPQAELRPGGGTLFGSPAPPLVVTWDAEAGKLVVTDSSSGRSSRVTPAALYHYRHDRMILDGKGKKAAQQVNGLAALDADGLVLLDIPGMWPSTEVAALAARAGIPVVSALEAAPAQVRAVLAGRAPGSSRFVPGPPPPRLTPKQRQIAMYAAGAAGLVVMATLASTVGWLGWRGLSMIGRFLLDVLEVKWLAIFFSPLLIVLRPAHRAWHRRRAGRGKILGPPGGPNLSVRDEGVLRVWPGRPMVHDRLPLGPAPGEAASLLVYRYATVSGLFIMSGNDKPLRHLPGPWDPKRPTASPRSRAWRSPCAR